MYSICKYNQTLRVEVERLSLDLFKFRGEKLQNDIQPRLEDINSINGDENTQLCEVQESYVICQHDICIGMILFSDCAFADNYLEIDCIEIASKYRERKHFKNFLSWFMYESEFMRIKTAIVLIPISEKASSIFKKCGFSSYNQEYLIKNK